MFVWAAFTSVMGTVRLPALLAGVAAFTEGRVEKSGDAESAGTLAAAANGTRRAVCCPTGRAATGCGASGGGGGSGTGAVATVCGAGLAACCRTGRGAIGCGASGAGGGSGTSAVDTVCVAC